MPEFKRGKKKRVSVDLESVIFLPRLEYSICTVTRVEEEKAINRALTGSADSNRRSSERTVSPAPPSRIPKFFGANYKKVQVEIV